VVRRVDFIIPFRSKSTTKDWESVCATLQNTVKSACRSINENYRVLIACHELPKIHTDSSKCSFIQVDFAPPERSHETSATDLIFRQRTDKGRKILTALSHSRENGSQYFMVLDADDYVSKHLVGYCLEHNNSNGYYIYRGYRTDPLFPNWVFTRNSFFRECGSSFILDTLKAPFPPESENFKEKTFDDYFVRRYSNHAFIPACMNGMGYPLQAIPFPAAIYHFHQENIYANKHRRPERSIRPFLRLMLRGKRVTHEIREEFAFIENGSP
jgi:hypothetical protein